jgi:1-acyl-sn-glycerol-3-phosphate acyltransferase
MPIRRAIAKVMLKVSRWKIVGDVPRDTSFALVGAPHTTNWDFMLFVMAVWFLEIKPAYIAKHSLFKPGVAWFFRGLGGIPVDRSKSQSLVDQVTAHFHADDNFALVMAPKGTRSYREYWKTGFLIIARGAKVPLIAASINYETRTVTIGGPIDSSAPTKDIMDQLRLDLSDGVGKKREAEGPIRLKDES